MVAHVRTFRDSSLRLITGLLLFRLCVGTVAQERHICMELACVLTRSKRLQDLGG